MRKAAKDEAAQEGARIRQETERELAKIQTNADHEIANRAQDRADRAEELFRANWRSIWRERRFATG